MSDRRKSIWIAALACVASAMPVALALATPNSASDRTSVVGPSSSQLVISPDAQQLLTQVSRAYTALNSLKVAGTCSGSFDIDGEKREHRATFTGIAAGGKFRSAESGAAIVGNTGQLLYVYQPDNNQFSTSQLPAGGMSLETFGQDLSDLLRNQDLSLALGLSSDPAAALTASATHISRLPASTVNGTRCDALKIAAPDGDLTLDFDARSHLLCRQISDLTKSAAMMGAKNIARAIYQVDFVNTPNVAVAPRTFAWSPPAGAQEIDMDASVGQTLPPFSLKDLNGKTRSSQDFKGTVFALNFWATWCAPCVGEMPELDALATHLQSSGFKLIGIDEDGSDNLDDVKKFLAAHPLAYPIAIDGDGKYLSQFSSEGIPVTVVVGRDDKVRAIIVGAHVDQIAAEVQKALAAK